MGSVKTITTCLDSDGGGQEEERRPKKKKKQFSDFITYDHYGRFESNVVLDPQLNSESFEKYKRNICRRDVLVVDTKG
uniref:Uncharacterized protein n=1 Tax=Magallana gigas TaxID=29159 RepID=K1QKC8_MAGGI